MNQFLVTIFLFLCIDSVHARDLENHFDDQQQYEIFYEFVYQANVVESFLLECTGTRDVSYKFAFATAPISNAYKREVLKVSKIGFDPFTGKSASSLLWDEIMIHFSRSPSKYHDDSEPTISAQRTVMQLFKDFQDDQDLLCDYIFWEEVWAFEDILEAFLSDGRKRISEQSRLVEFDKSVSEGLPTIFKLFAANPLK